MPIQKYDFVTGIENADAPASSAAAVIGDSFVLGYQTQFTIADNHAAANVTGALFDKTVYRAVLLQGTIYRSAAGGLTRAHVVNIMMVNDGTDWEIQVSGVSCPSDDDAGVDFSVTSSGQLQYVSDANGGSYSSATSWLKWKIVDLVAV